MTGSVTPPIGRVEPSGHVTRVEQGLPIVVTIRWDDGQVTEAPGTVYAWTRTEVQVNWHPPAPWPSPRTDWVPAADVRRPGRNPL
jgi:hypothetical protein